MRLRDAVPKLFQRDDEEPSGPGRHDELVAGRREAQGHDAVAVLGSQRPERTAGAVHAAEIIHAHAVVQRTGDEARSGWVERQRGYSLATPQHTPT